MKFEETAIEGAWIVSMEPFADERGYFARSWCRNEFAAHGIDAEIAQANVSFNRYKHTLRGFHYQAAPNEESKLIRCNRGAAHNVILDLRRHSPTYKRHLPVQLSGDRFQMLVVPKGCANAFLTLQDETEIFYLISTCYAPESARGARWNDPAFGVEWPVQSPAVISDRDRMWPDHVD